MTQNNDNDCTNCVTPCRCNGPHNADQNVSCAGCGTKFKPWVIADRYFCLCCGWGIACDVCKSDIHVSVTIDGKNLCDFCESRVKVGDIPLADVAQLGEQLTCTEQVAGSTPAVGCPQCARLEERIEFLEALIDVVARDLSRAQAEIKRR